MPRQSRLPAHRYAVEPQDPCVFDVGISDRGQGSDAGNRPRPALAGWMRIMSVP